MKFSAKYVRRAAAVLVFFLAVAVIVLNAAREPAAANSPKSRSDAALLSSVGKEMNAKQLRSYARSIARSDPLHAVGFFLEVMALDADKKGSDEVRRKLIAEGAKRQPSFAAPRIWLTADDIRKERYDRAINGADTVMRLNSEYRTLLIPGLVPLLDNDNARPLLDAKLRDFPIWRTQFLTEAIKAGGHDARIEAMLRHKAPPRYAAAMAAERSAYLQSLIDKGQGARAFGLWQSFGVGKTRISDGDFSTPNPIYPFAWRLATDDYSYAEKISAGEGVGNLVRAHHGGDGRVGLMTQIVALIPGPHVLSFTMRDGGLAEPDRLFWRVRCLGAVDNLASRSLAKLAADWQRVQLRVEIPQTDCALQYLVLEAEPNDGDEVEVEIRQVEAS
jgi:hypothetical protein